MRQNDRRHGNCDRKKYIRGYKRVEGEETAQTAQTTSRDRLSDTGCDRIIDAISNIQKNCRINH